MKTAYPQVNGPEDVIPALKKIVQLRKQEDLPDYKNQFQQFPLGRSTGRIPSSATDVQPKDRVGDVTNDDTYLYQLLNINGTPTWNRITLNITW